MRRKCAGWRTRVSGPVSIIVCDVDDLKLINDTFGHGKGDSLLKAVAETIKSPFRSSDVIARIGGDEFVILLPLTSMDVAKKHAGA
ncbi:MAG: GGDEF domain-containing protein [Dethiobacteria bacterium]